MAGESSYTPGNCTWYLARLLAWVRGGWGNAYQWAAHAQAQGFHLTSTPTVGAVVVYGPGHGYSAWGHVAVVRAVYPLRLFLVSEMNAVGLYVVSSRVSNTYGVTAFILPPGVAAGAQPPTGPAVQPPVMERVSGAWSNLVWALDHDLRGALGYAGYIAGRLRGLR